MRHAICLALLLSACATAPRDKQSSATVAVGERRTYFVGQPAAPSQVALQSAVDQAIDGDDAKLAFVISLERFTDGEGALNFGDLLLQIRKRISARFSAVMASLPQNVRDGALGCMEAAEANRWPAHAQVFHDSDLFFRRDARSRQRWLILFSLGPATCMTGKEALHISSKREMRAWLRTASDKDLDEYLDEVSASNNFWIYATEERQRRQLAKLAKPHWSAVWTFWLVVIALVVSILAWLFPR